MLWSGLISGKDITNWIHFFITLTINVRQKSWGWIVARKLGKIFYLSTGTQNQHTRRLLLSFLRSLTVLMIMSNAFSGIFCPGYLCCEVLCLARCQRAAFSVGVFLIWMHWNKIFTEKCSSSVRHIKLFLMPALLWGPATSMPEATFNIQVLPLA